MACSGNVSFTLIGSQYVGVTTGGTLLVVECVGVGASGWVLTSTVGITSYLYSADPSSTCTPLSLSFSNVIIDCGVVNITLSANMAPCATSSAASAGSSSGGGGGGANPYVITGAGAGVYVAQGTSLVVECWGAGGGGADGVAVDNGGGGGGGGAYTISTYSVSIGQNINYYVGEGGAASVDGEDTWFDTSSVQLAKGGLGAPTPPFAGGAGGQAFDSIGDEKWSGGSGGQASFPGPSGGGGSGGGGSGDYNGSGSDGSSNNLEDGGAGGAAGGVNGGAGGEGAWFGSPPGDSGASPGGGGGGGATGVNPSDRLAGSGSNGKIRITWSS